MMLPSETSERFLRAIVAQVNAERIAEIHFFGPIRQGGVESGVAVVAAWPESPTAGQQAERPLADGPEIEPSEPESLRRPVVYTARYRLALKGPDRGKWECSVVAEAEAPLGMVDTVVRGVLRRAGDADDATRLDGGEIRTFLETRHSGANPVG
jgi:hypothetical protein